MRKKVDREREENEKGKEVDIGREEKRERKNEIDRDRKESEKEEVDREKIKSGRQLGEEERERKSGVNKIKEKKMGGDRVYIERG